MNDHRTPETNPLAIISLVFGILGWTLLPFIGMIVAIVTGHLALGQIRQSAGTQSGDGLAIAGLALGYVALAVSLMVLILLAFGISVLFFLA